MFAQKLRHPLEHFYSNQTVIWWPEAADCVAQPRSRCHSFSTVIRGATGLRLRAFGYTVDDDEVIESDQSSTSAVLGDGGIYTSVRDYFKWDQALYTEKLLSYETLTEMWTGNFGDYGLGWRVDVKEGHRRLHHDGSTSGFRNYIIRYPDEKMTVLVLTNRRGPDVMPLAESIAEIFLP